MSWRYPLPNIARCDTIVGEVVYERFQIQIGFCGFGQYGSGDRARRAVVRHARKERYRHVQHFGQFADRRRRMHRRQRLCRGKQRISRACGQAASLQEHCSFAPSGKLGGGRQHHGGLEVRGRRKRARHLRQHHQGHAEYAFKGRYGRDRDRRKSLLGREQRMARPRSPKIIARARATHSAARCSRA